MDEDNLGKPQNSIDSVESTNQSSVPSPITAPSQPELKKPFNTKKWLIIAIVVVAVLGIGIGLWLTFGGEEAQNSATDTADINSYDACVAAGYPIMESSPEQCSVPGGATFINTVEEVQSIEEATTVVPKSCDEDETLFADKEFGATFCYPAEWGDASVLDAKIDSTDTGYREAVRFSANTKFIVGGVSEDWTTTVGRGLGCQEPNNAVPGPDSFNTEWHDITGEGMDIEFATRSIAPAIVSGSSYDLTETVSNLLDNGVCAQGHTVINGSRYLLLSAAYYSDFSESLGITTPKAHMDNPTILFTIQERQDLESVLASATSY